MTTKNLSYHPFHSISLNCVSEPARNTDPHARLRRSGKDTKLEVLPLPRSPLVEHALKICLSLEAHPRGKPAIFAVTHTKTIANSAIHCKNTCLASICAHNFRPQGFPWRFVCQNTTADRPLRENTLLPFASLATHYSSARGHTPYLSLARSLSSAQGLPVRE